jgi:chromosome segregation ATPase
VITEELVDRLVEATREAKEAVRECHEARRDLRIAIKEADDRLGKVREEVETAVGELATAKTAEAFDSIQLVQISNGLKETLDRWLGLLSDGQDVLERLNERERLLADPMSRFLPNR